MDPYSYLCRLSILSGRAQSTFSRAHALLGPTVNKPLATSCDYPNIIVASCGQTTISFHIHGMIFSHPNVKRKMLAGHVR